MLFPSLVRVSPFRISLPSSFCLSTLGPLGFCSASLDSGLFLWFLLRLSCASSRLACFAHGPFLSLLVPGSSFLFLSLSLRLVFLVPSCGFFLGFLVRLFFGWLSLLSFLPFCCAYVTSSPVSLLYFRFRSFRCLWCSSVCFSFLTVPAHQISLSLSFSCFFPLLQSLCMSSFSCPLFFSSFFCFLFIQVLHFPFQGFPFVSCCGSVFYLPVDEIAVIVPLFIVVDLVLFSCCYLARFPSLSTGSESLGWGGPLTLHRFV